MAASRDRDIQIDHLFAAPPNVIDANPAQEENPEYEILGPAEGDFGDFVDVGGEEIAATDNVPNIPINISIVSQKVGIGTDGSAATDVVLEISTIPGVFDVEVRNSRA